MLAANGEDEEKQMSLNQSKIQKNLVIVSGLAGSGKTLVSHTLEDLGYYCIDNIPPLLLKSFTSLEVINSIPSDHIALELDSRDSNTPHALELVFQKLSEICKTEFLFLEASQKSLLHRFRETRRHHPLIANGKTHNLADAISTDIKTLSPLKKLATHVVDTSNFAPQDLRRYVLKNFSYKNETKGLKLNFISFGFKHGIPNDLDTLFDVRCFKNPHYVPELKPLTGLNTTVRDYVFNDKNVQTFLEKVIDFIDFMYPCYIDEGKHFFNVGIGCTGGKHRSVALTEALYKHFKSRLPFVTIEHRNIDE